MFSREHSTVVPAGAASQILPHDVLVVHTSSWWQTFVTAALVTTTRHCFHVFIVLTLRPKTCLRCGGDGVIRSDFVEPAAAGCVRSPALQ